jgi:hypothetical protein
MNKKMLLLGSSLCMALLAAQPVQAQFNYVQNGNFETGPALCVTNGPFYLAQGYVDSWTGINMGTNGANYPVNTGNVHDGSVTCTFGKFQPGYGAYSGNRAINLYMAYQFGTFINDARARGILSFALGGRSGGNYRLCISINGFPDAVSLPVINSVEIVLYSSGGLIGEKIIDQFSIANINSWGSRSKPFSISAAEAGKYDRIEIRFMRLTGSGNYEAAAYFDRVGIFDDAGGTFNCATATINAEVPLDLSAMKALQTGEPRVVPNPATDQVELVLTPNTPAGTYRITDLQGRLIGQGTTTGEKTRIDVSTLTPGMYFIYAGNSGDNKAVKFIKK